MIGVLFFIIFLMNTDVKNIIYSRTNKLKATSCQSVMVMLEKRLLAGQSAKCNNNNLEVEVKAPFLAAKYKDQNRFRGDMYREVANNLMFVSKNSPSDGLSRVDIVTMKVIADKMTISAVTEGKFIVELATLKSKDGMAEHLKATVKVKEFVK